MRGLAARSVLGGVQLLLVLGLAVFGPAGTFAFWQAWLYLAVFFGSAAAISVYLWNADRALLERRLSAGPRAEQRRGQQVIQAIAAVAFLGLFVVSALDHRNAWSSVPAWLSLAADVLVVLGFAVVLLVFRENTFTTAVIQVADQQAVISSGPYALVRHPMYAGALLLLAATPVALGSLWGLVLFAPLLLGIAWRLGDEETFLASNLPGYAAYRARVRSRLVPGIW